MQKSLRGVLGVSPGRVFISNKMYREKETENVKSEKSLFLNSQFPKIKVSTIFNQ